MTSFLLPPFIIENLISSELGNASGFEGDRYSYTARSDFLEVQLGALRSRRHEFASQVQVMSHIGPMSPFAWETIESNPEARIETHSRSYLVGPSPLGVRPRPHCLPNSIPRQSPRQLTGYNQRPRDPFKGYRPSLVAPDVANKRH